MPPAQPPAGEFFAYLLAANRPRLEGFCHWLFHPGMLFRASRQWWGQQKTRPTPHEGLDICWFRDRHGCHRALPASTLIPAPFPGRVVAIRPDFLGQSLFLVHPALGTAGREVLTALGHTQPLPGVEVGTTVQAGDNLATLAAPASRAASVPPHLHLTVAVLPADYPLSDLTWKKLSANPLFQLWDPLIVFPTTFARVESEVA